VKTRKAENVKAERGKCDEIYFGNLY